MQFTLRKENRAGKLHWYAYRKAGGVQFKRYVGYDESITPSRLLEVAQKLPG